MSWFRIDDNLHDHPKWVAVLAEARRRNPKDRAKARTLAQHAAMAWWSAGVWGSGVNCDAIVPESAAASIGPRGFLTEDEFLDAAEILVTAGLWHRFENSRRPRCSCMTRREMADTKLTGSGWIIHDWHDYQKAKQQVVKSESREKRRKQLYNTTEGKAVVEAVKHRDGRWCRYCWREVTWEARRGNSAATIDHVDPDGPNSVDNCVVACQQCNRRKWEQTPEQAEMALRPPKFGDQRDLTVSDRGQNADRLGLDSARGTGRAGTGQNGPGRDGTERAHTPRQEPRTATEAVLEAFPGTQLSTTAGDPA